MIPASAITFDGDTALVVVRYCDGNHPEGENLLCDLACVARNRPCDTCGGIGDLLPSSGDWRNCPDCHGSKRHTFDIEVSSDVSVPVGNPQTDGWRVHTYSVHVIDVLELDGEFLWFDDCQHDGGQWLHQPDGRDGDATVITLPPDAARLLAEGKKPHVVRLAVHQ